MSVGIFPGWQISDTVCYCAKGHYERDKDRLSYNRHVDTVLALFIIGDISVNTDGNSSLPHHAPYVITFDTLNRCSRISIENWRTCEVENLRYKCIVQRSQMSNDKKLCRCRGTARRATNTKYRTWKGLQLGNDLQGHSIPLQLLLLDRPYVRLRVSFPVSGLSRTVSKILPLFQCKWLLVTFRNPSPLIIKFKSQTTCAFQLMCKHTVVKMRYISWVMSITKV